MEIDGKHYFYCVFCGRNVEVPHYNCVKDRPNDPKVKTYKGSL